MGPIPEEFVLLDQDGTDRTLITLPDCYEQVNAFLMEGENTANTMADIGGDIYIFRPSQMTGMLIYRQLWHSACQSYFSGDEKGGVLATFYQATQEVSPELILYELPGGKIRERFPLVQCAQGATICEKYRSNWSEMMRQNPQWSPNGRYLAFASILDAASSDLFVYDSQNGRLRRLTNGPDWVGPIEWSPDGTKIIMQELLNDEEFLFAPYSKTPSSVWSVSVDTNEIKLLYSTAEALTEQNIEYWLDDQRFIAYEGYLVNADQARGLRLVDVEAGTNRILFGGVFVMLSFDPVHEVFIIYEQNTEICLPSTMCIVSVKDGSIRPVGDQPYSISFPWWDENTGMFVSGDDCENDPQSLQAFNYQGTPVCVPKLEPTPEPPENASHPAPDGKQTLTVKDGLWLESQGQAEIQISPDVPSDVTWCPDSTCFFFSVPQPDNTWTLYHVSLPGLEMKKVDEGIQSKGTYQWLGGDK
jgi:dipeptidyl aminopeptidase/acylaminoacyl peptidase